MMIIIRMIRQRRPLPDDHAGVEAPPEQELAGGHDVVIRTQAGAESRKCLLKFF